MNARLRLGGHLAVSLNMRNLPRSVRDEKYKVSPWHLLDVDLFRANQLEFHLPSATFSSESQVYPVPLSPNEPDQTVSDHTDPG